MSLYDKSSLVLIPSGAKNGKVFSQKPVSGAGDFTFSRGSNLSATRVNASQLIEKGRENIFVQSNQFDTTWLLASATITGGQSGYDGTNNAWKLQDTAVSAEHFVRQTPNVGNIVSVSVYAKANTLNFLWLRSVEGGVNKRTWFDLSSGSVGTSQGIDANIESVGNGWYRCSATFNHQAAFEYYIAISDANGSSSYAGTGNGSIYIQDAQLEKSLVATPYIETGASTAQAGILENTPRFDYSGGATCPSLLLEGSRTNLVTQSEYFGDSSWVKYGVGVGITPIVTPNYAISPDGTQNASRLQCDLNGGNTTSDRSWLYQAITTISGDNTFSLYVKNNLNEEITFTLSNGSSETVVVLSDGKWHRLSTVKSGGGQPRIGLIGGVGASDTADLSIYGAQLEQGSYPTSYIPTMGVSQTRAVDDVNELTGATSLIGQSEGTMFLDFVANDDDALQIIYQVRTTGSTNLGQVDFRIQSGNLRALGNDGGSPQYNISAGAAVVGTRYKCAVRYATNDVAFYVNGVLKGTDTNASFGSSSLDQITFNENGSLYSPSVNVKQALLFKTGLTNTELASLTTI